MYTQYIPYLHQTKTGSLGCIKWRGSNIKVHHKTAGSGSDTKHNTIYGIEKNAISLIKTFPSQINKLHGCEHQLVVLVSLINQHNIAPVDVAHLKVEGYTNTKIRQH